MEENYNAMQEYLRFIRQRESEKLDRLKQSGKLPEYILNLNGEMIEKYPEMIARVYTKEEIDDGQGGM